MQPRRKSFLHRKSHLVVFGSVREQRGSQLSAAVSITMLSTNQLPKGFTSGADEISYRSRQEKSVASVFLQ